MNEHLKGVDIEEKFAQFDDVWAPKVVARLNDCEVKLVRLAGEFVWHSHPDTDEMFMVLDGTLTIQMRDHSARLTASQILVVPRGVEHRPVAHGQVRALLIELSGTVNTGTVGGVFTAQYDDSLA